jgi:hypothetical protein
LPLGFFFFLFLLFSNLARFLSSFFAFSFYLSIFILSLFHQSREREMRCLLVKNAGVLTIAMEVTARTGEPVEMARCGWVGTAEKVTSGAGMEHGGCSGQAPGLGSPTTVQVMRSGLIGVVAEFWEATA